MLTKLGVQASSPIFTQPAMETRDRFISETMNIPLLYMWAFVLWVCQKLWIFKRYALQSRATAIELVKILPTARSHLSKFITSDSFLLCYGISLSF